MAVPVNYNWDTACEIAQADAYHDFKTAFGPQQELRELVGKLTQPVICGTEKRSTKSEDNIIRHLILQPGVTAAKIKLGSNQGMIKVPEVGENAWYGHVNNSGELFTPDITKQYEVYYVRRKGPHAERNLQENDGGTTEEAAEGKKAQRV